MIKALTHFCLIVLLTLTIGNGAKGSQFDTDQYQGVGDAEQFEALKDLAEQGDSKAIFGVGLVYYIGDLGQEKNIKKAVRWLQMSAKQGNADASYFLGHLYESGEGVIQNFKTAADFYRQGAEEGSPEAQNALGEMYENGQGVAQNHTKAVKWFQQGAQQGHPYSQEDLGRMYGIGNGVKQNTLKAHMWFNIAAAQGLETAMNNRDVVAEHMTAAQIAEAQQLARECVDSNFQDC